MISSDSLATSTGNCVLLILDEDSLTVHYYVKFKMVTIVRILKLSFNDINCGFLHVVMLSLSAIIAFVSRNHFINGEQK